MSSVINETLLAIKSAFEAGVNIFNGGSAVNSSNPLPVAQTSGSIFTVDINSGGTTILSTKLTIDNTEKTSTTAATAAVISDVNLADGIIIHRNVIP